MGLKPKFTRHDIRDALEKRVKLMDKAIINTLSYLGEQCVNQARSLNTYQDQTGNLRNSTGYVIVKNGRVIRNNFKRSATVTVVSKRGKSRTTKGSKDGLAAGQDLANELAGEHSRGYALIVVAGMNYAAAVESRGLDVLTSAEQLAEQELPRMLRELKADVGTAVK